MPYTAGIYPTLASACILMFISEVLFAMIQLATFLFLICVLLEPALSVHGQAATMELIALSRDNRSTNGMKLLGVHTL